MYKSPITIMHRQLANQINVQLEGEVLKAVMKCNIDVNKDELIKALNYDRQQYEKGYKDGVADANMQLLELEDIDEVARKLHKFLLKNKVTIKATSDAELLITDQETGEERVYKDLGYPI